jgi:glycine/D-amino acid oxidase-like deaminating enzyme
MPDVIVVGGGIVGAACCYELALAGASVTLIERDELAAGASGRNNGLWVTPVDPELLPMARASIARYLEIADEAPVPLRLDREPIGLLAVAVDGNELRLGDAAHEPYRASGVGVEFLDADATRRLEPALAPDVLGGWLVDHGHRLAPAALTVSLALMAKTHGAEIRHHLPVRALTIGPDDRVTGAVTDEGRIGADDVVVAAGPWTPALLDPIGESLPIIGARGWLVRLAPARPPVGRLVASAGWEVATGRLGEGRVQARGFRDPGVATATLLHPTTDGGLIAGSSRQPAIGPEAEDPGVPARILDAAIRLVPGLADAEVRSAWWGVRPMTPDEHPLVGRLRPGLVVASGHGSEGVILGAGTGRLVASTILGSAPPFDPEPFGPRRDGLSNERTTPKD